MTWFNPGVIVGFVLSLLASGIGGMWYGSSQANAKWERREQAATIQAQKDSLQLALMVQRRASEVNDVLTKQLKRSQQNEKRLQAALGEAGKCVVPGSAVGVLDDATEMPYAPRTPTGVGQGSTPSDSTLARELELCRRNYEEVAIPNAVVQKNLRDFYNEAREKYNKAIAK